MQLPITPTIAVLGLLLGIVNLIRDVYRRIRDNTEKRSQFHLDACLKGYQEARSLLADGNNDRATWIQAARALKHAQALSKSINTEQHEMLLELHRLDYRGFFYHALQRTAAFFYGANDSAMPLEKAAAQSTAPETRQGRFVGSTAKEIDPRSIHAVWEAAQWAQDFADPLNSDFSEAETGRLIVLYPGLAEFLQHKKIWVSGSGKLFRVDEDPSANI
jgi:hypothetical protein